MVIACSMCGRMTDNPAHPQLFCRTCQVKVYPPHGISPNDRSVESPRRPGGCVCRITYNLRRFRRRVSSGAIGVVYHCRTCRRRLGLSHRGRTFRM